MIFLKTQYIAKRVGLFSFFKRSLVVTGVVVCHDVTN